MTLQFPARFVDKQHTAVMSQISVRVEHGEIIAPIRLVFRGLVFELRRVNGDAVLVYHQEQRTQKSASK